MANRQYFNWSIVCLYYDSYLSLYRCGQTQNVGGSCNAASGYHLSSFARWQSCCGPNALDYFAYPQSQVSFLCFSARSSACCSLAFITFHCSEIFISDHVSGPGKPIGGFGPKCVHPLCLCVRTPNNNFKRNDF